MNDALPTLRASTDHKIRTTIGVIATAALFGALAHVGVDWTRSNGIAALWLPNAVLVGILLRTRSNTCPWFVAACFVANIFVNLAHGDAFSLAAMLALANAIEVVVAVAAMRRLFGRNPVVEDLHVLGGFLAVALFAPLLSGIVACAGLAMNGLPGFAAYGSWIVADALSLAIITPLILVAVDAWRARSIPRVSDVGNWASLILIALAGSAIIFSQERYPLLFLACPIVVIAAFRGGTTGTAVSTAIVGSVASIATFFDHGPVMLVSGATATRVFVLQTFLATAFAIGLPVAAALAGREALRLQLDHAQAFSKTMLDNMQEIIFRTDTRGRWTFLNPAWEALTGYDVETCLGWSTTALLHPDDHAGAAQTYPKIVSGEIAEATLKQRFRHASGEWRCIEVRVRRLIAGDGAFIGTTGNIRDISDAVRRERELAESEARFRCMAEAAPVGIFRADADGQVTYVNRAWCEKIGLTVQESLGSGWMRALGDANIYEDDPAFTGFHSPGDVRRRTVRFRGADGDDLWVETVNAAEFDDAGQITGFVGVVVDITEQRLALEALRDSERKFQTLADLAPAGIFRTDGQGNCNYVNASWLGLTGFVDDGWMNDGWASALHPDDRDRVFAAWESAVAAQRDFREEWRWVRKDGSISWVDGIGRPEVDEHGTVSSFVGVNIDITERRIAEAKLAEREAQLELLATNATDAVFRIGLDGRCIYASPSVKRMTGVDPLQIVGRQMLARFHPEDCATVTDAFLELASGAKSETIITYRSEVAGRPGEYRWLEANCGLVRSDAGMPSEVIASIRDVTAKKRLEEDLRQARERAENAASAKAAFLANMSHEIRTPMNGVLGFTELLSNSKLDDQQRKQVQLISESGRAMMRLLNDILDISKIESGQMQIANEAMDLRHKLNNCARLMEPVAVAKGLTLTMDFDPSLPIRIVSDPLRIRQIVLNLIGNATKFTDHGGVTVRVTTEGEDDCRQMRIAVTDTGIGIPADRVDTIFQQFAQADPSIARRFGGSGLGLSISSELARLMGGWIDVHSVAGQGSTFTVYLPLVEDASPFIEELPQSQDNPGSVASKFRARILIAEDHDINQMLMLSIATTAGFEATIAGDGAEAVAMVEQAEAEGKPFDLVFMDMQMPGVDGLEATRRLRARGFAADRLPIVALTANAFQDDVAACRVAGMQAHLTKPVSVQDISEMIGRFAAPPQIKTKAMTSQAPSVRTAEDLYVERRAATLEAVAAAVRQGRFEGGQVQEIASLLHKLAGTAGFFGEQALGSVAADIEEQLRDAAPGDVPAIISAGLARLSSAA